MKILVTGGAGYIGSHTCVELLNTGYDIVVVDNFSNSSPKAIERIKEITGRSFEFYKIDICEESAMKIMFSQNEIDCVIHFAGFKAVGESTKKPLEYYSNNLRSTICLCKLMKEFIIRNIIFSSSATVYRANNKMPLVEDCELGCSNPYGWTKYMSEQILRDMIVAEKNWSVVLLRYFNPIGAHSSGMIGENPAGIPNNLLPYIAQTAIGKREVLSVFGDDYDTVDGTGVRDYVHVVDLAKGHVTAIKYCAEHTGIEAFNLGTGKGTSVLQMVSTFENVNNVRIPYAITEKRAGDLAICFANVEKAEQMLGWKAEKGIEQMCRDTWKWQIMNPNGYNDKRQKLNKDLL